VPFLVYFMLSWRDHIHRTFLHFFQGGDRIIAARSLRGVGDMVRGYVVGNFVLGCMLAALSSTAFWLMHLEYPLLAGPMSGFLSLVPYVGLPLAMVPPLFVLLAAGGEVSTAFAIVSIVAVLHLMALNLFYPKVVGARVHLNPLVVTFSLMFWGFLWDAAGLLLAIPLTAAIKAVCDNVVSLRPYGRFLGD
jgi:predicted PurR-regulated permease PerM